MKADKLCDNALQCKCGMRPFFLECLNVPRTSPVWSKISCCPSPARSWLRVMPLQPLQQSLTLQQFDVAGVR
jgi:hypothetical protein